MARKKRGAWKFDQVQTQPAKDNLYVSVFCDGRDGNEASAHDEKGRWRIASFRFYMTPNGHASWQEYDNKYIEPVDAETVSVIPIAGTVTQMLDDDQVTDEVAESPEFRVRWSLRCPVCGLARVIAQPDRFYAAFAALSALGSVEVPLRRLVHAQGASN